MIPYNEDDGAAVKALAFHAIVPGTIPGAKPFVNFVRHRVHFKKKNLCINFDYFYYGFGVLSR